MGEVSFWIKGDPQGKGRPRFTKSGHTYTPQKTKDYEELIKLSYNGKKLNGAIEAEIKINHGIPKSWSKKEKQRAIIGAKVPKVKPDIDNVLKAIFDSLNGVAYDDDRQIVSVNVTKSYDMIPSVFVRLREMEEEDFKVGGTD